MSSRLFTGTGKLRYDMTNPKVKVDIPIWKDQTGIDPFSYVPPPRPIPPVNAPWQRCATPVRFNQPNRQELASSEYDMTNPKVKVDMPIWKDQTGINPFSYVPPPRPIPPVNAPWQRCSTPRFSQPNRQELASSEYDMTDPKVKVDMPIWKDQTGIDPFSYVPPPRPIPPVNASWQCCEIPVRFNQPNTRTSTVTIDRFTRGYPYPTPAVSRATQLVSRGNGMEIIISSVKACNPTVRRVSRCGVHVFIRVMRFERARVRQRIGVNAQPGLNMIYLCQQTSFS